MPPPDFGDSGNPFQFLLGDLMNVLGSNVPDQWEMTRSFGLNVATGGTAESNVDPVDRIRLEELARVAQRIAVLRDGKLVCVEPMANYNSEQLVTLMVGR
jgi:hypothetical protein